MEKFVIPVIVLIALLVIALDVWMKWPAFKNPKDWTFCPRCHGAVKRGEFCHCMPPPMPVTPQPTFHGGELLSKSSTPGAMEEAVAFDEISDIIESFEFEIEDGGPDASNICVPITDAKKLLRAYAEVVSLNTIQHERIVELDLEAMERCRRIAGLEVALDREREDNPANSDTIMMLRLGDYHDNSRGLRLLAEDRATSAEAERDEARGRLEKAAWLAEVAVLIVEWTDEGGQRPFDQWMSIGLIYEAALNACEEV